MTLRALLRHVGYQVVGEARDGESGLALVQRLQPDIVCLDVQLPGINGVDVLRGLRALYPELVVVIVSGQIDRDTMAKVIEAGANGVVVKPVSEARLVSALEKAVEASARRREAGEAVSRAGGAGKKELP